MVNEIRRSFASLRTTKRRWELKMMELESMAVEMPKVEGHPNRAAFRGVLTMVDVASERAPSGSSGRRVVLTRAAAEAALPSLLGMALDYAPTFDRHDVRRKVGVITSAEIVGRNLEVGGYLYARDFPEIVEEIGKCGGHIGAADINPGAAPRRTGKDGMRAAVSSGWRESLSQAAGELRNMTHTQRPQRQRARGLQAESGGGTGLGMSYEVTDVVLLDKRARVWTLIKVTFTGAAILRRSKAAYEETWIELR
jgi:hypothetical protein